MNKSGFESLLRSGQGRRVIEVGYTVPGVLSSDQDGRTWRTSSSTAKGIALVFWGSPCAPSTAWLLAEGQSPQRVRADIESGTTTFILAGVDAATMDEAVEIVRGRL